MDTPQEVEVWFVLPALRRLFVLSLKKQGLKQKKIALILGITEPAISQYLRNKRGDNIKFSEDIIKDVDDSCSRIVNNSSFRTEFQNILKKIRETRYICSVCHDHTDSKENCKICY